MRHDLAALFLLLAVHTLPSWAQSPLSQPDGSIVIQSGDMKLTVPNSKNWQFKMLEGGTDYFGVRDKGRFFMDIQFIQMALEKATVDYGSFKKIDGKWYKFGRSSQVPAIPFTSHGLHGLYGIADCGVDDELGYHAGAGTCLEAILSNGRWSVVIGTDGKIDTTWVLQNIIKNVQFQP